MPRLARLIIPVGFVAAFALACGGNDGLTTPAARGLAASGAVMDRASAPGRTGTAPGQARKGGPDGSTQAATTEEDTVLVIKRTTPIASDLTVGADIGPAGGTLRIDAAGVVVTFPAGALAQMTHITMTANAGWDVSYEFAPHGITFAVPVRVRQELRQTFVERFPTLIPSLTGAYYEGSLRNDFVDPWHFFADVKELRPGTSDPRGCEFTFYVNHFSGYVLASGRYDRTQ